MSNELRTKPNVLIVIIDSLRADHLSCYGHHRETTPNIDRLAAEGCLFEACITAAPFSPSSYASLFSNLHPHQHGVNGDTVRVWPNSWPRLPERMQEQGYYTFCLSNNSFVSQATNCDRGFDAFVGIPELTWVLRQQERVVRRVRKYCGDRWAETLSSNALQCAMKGDSEETVRRTISLIESTERPFFGLLILMDPHTPYNKSRTRYSGNSLAVRRFMSRTNNRTMWTDLMAKNTGLPESETQIAKDLFDAEAHYADRCIGTLVSRLSDLGRLDDTIVAITADHGEAFGEHGVWGHGFCLNDCLTRVPLVLRHPGYWTAGTRCSGLVQLHDLHELCLGVASTGTPEIDSHPHCLTQAENPAWSGHEVVFSEFPRQSKTMEFMHQRNPDFAPGVWDCDMWAVRSRDWRYVEYGNGQVELYDLTNDPQESSSVHERHPDVCVELRQRLDAHRTDRPHSSSTDGASHGVDDVVAERLRALGYIE